VIYMPAAFLFMPGMMTGAEQNPDELDLLVIINLLLSLLQMAVSFGYATWFVGKFGATPGKMACKLQVVTAEGGRVTYLRALGRAFAEIISSIILLIGYIMAAFDDQKRTLHDRICSTRVIRR